jgi:hypothetical protein
MSGTTLELDGHRLTVHDGGKRVTLHARRELPKELRMRLYRRAQATVRGQSREVDWEALSAQVRRLHPVDPGLNRSTATSAITDANVNHWGARSHDWPAWQGGNCLRMCLATWLQRKPASIPDPARHFSSSEDWFEAYNRELADRAGIRLVEIPPASCPPARRETWIAAVSSGDVDHALLAREEIILHDPADRQSNGGPVPRGRLRYGLRIVPANAPKTGRWGKAIR